MKTVKLSDFSPYDRNKGGIQELHHKIESKTLQYWGKDSGILIGITPIYMFWETFEKLDLDTGDATWLHQSYCCDHCVNHWGIGLCGCGSGQKVGKCECGSQKAHDILGVKYDSFGAILKNFG